jgi:outer membrane protein assembly factor BamB
VKGIRGQLGTLICAAAVAGMLCALAGAWLARGAAGQEAGPAPAGAGTAATEAEGQDYAEPVAGSDDEDWPTWLHDNQRSGTAPRELPLPLAAAWTYRPRHAPQPAWPPPARQDFWNRKYDLAPRVVFDRAFHVVVAGERVYFGSSADDRVTCLDLAGGKCRWSFFAEGPIRLAPTVAEGRVLVGSDDGAAYCLDAADGKCLWTSRPAPADRRIPGNERIISVTPVRTGVLVAGGTANFCAGMFPLEGVWRAEVDLRTGRTLAVEQVAASAQGYIQLLNDRLMVATGGDAGTRRRKVAGNR